VSFFFGANPGPFQALHCYGQVSKLSSGGRRGGLRVRIGPFQERGNLEIQELIKITQCFSLSFEGDLEQ
jgi:hypothetical protein